MSSFVPKVESTSGVSQRVLLLSYHYLPENVPSTLHPRYFKRYLPEFGFEVDIVCSSFSPFGGYDSPDPDSNPTIIRTPLGKARDRMKELHRWERFFGHHLKFTDWGRPWIPYAAEAGNELMARRNYRMMISCSPCFSVHRAAMRLKRQHPQLPWFAYLADPFVGNPFHEVNALQSMLDKRLERRIFTAADGVIANTEVVEGEWKRRYSGMASKFFTIPNGFDFSEDVRALPIPVDRQAKILMHAGGLYGGRFPKMLLESIDRLSNAGLVSQTDIQVRLVGVIPPKVSCPDLVASMQQRGFLFLEGVCSRAEALRRTGEADYLLLIDLNEKNSKFQVPSKLFDYMRIGRPILCYTPRGSETQRILLHSGVPATIIEAEATAEQSDLQLLEFLKMPNDPVEMSAATRKQFDAREMTRFLVSKFPGELRVEHPELIER
jgi:glycosyltransferase involved in cell wall biosynthesis